MNKPLFKLGEPVKVTFSTKMPELEDKTGIVVKYFECPTHILYGVSFDYWSNGHSLKASNYKVPENISILIGKNNCWWMEETEITSKEE